jgi:hypothetical protein
VRYDVWRRDARREASTRVEVIDEAGAVVFARDNAVPPARDRNGAGAPIDLDVPLASLPAGGYRLVVTAAGDEREARREVGFAVRVVR